MDDLEIKIAIVFKVPRSALSLNGLLHGLVRDRDRIMRETLVQIFAALEERLGEDYPGDRYVRNGRQSSARQFLTSFGPVRYALAQVVERTTGRTIQPLAVLLRIPAYRRYHGEIMEAPLGQAVHLSYRLAARETIRIRGQGPAKSTIWSWMQEMGASKPWPSLRSIPFTFLMVDGTDVKRQPGPGTMQMRWAWAAEGPGKSFQIVGFWVGKDWTEIRQDLDRRLDYGRLRMLFADGELGIPAALLTDQMEIQRCIWHGLHDFRFILYQDGVKGSDQTIWREAMKANPLFTLRKAQLETYGPQDEGRIRERLAIIEKGFEDLLEVMPKDKYPKTRSYVMNPIFPK